MANPPSLTLEQAQALCDPAVRNPAVGSGRDGTPRLEHAEDIVAAKIGLATGESRLDVAAGAGIARSTLRWGRGAALVC